MRIPTTVLVAMAFLGGCARAESAGAKNPSAHISVAMDEATHRALLGMADDDELSGPVGTTSLTSAEIYVAPPTPKAAVDRAALANLPDERGALPVLRTWGAGTEPTDTDGLPATRE